MIQYADGKERFMEASQMFRDGADVVLDTPVICVIYGEDEDHFIGEIVRLPASHLRFPKFATRELQGKEREGAEKLYARQMALA